MDVLFLTTVLPHGRAGGSEIVSQGLIDALRSDGHRVTVLGYLRPGEAAPPDAGVEVAGTRSIETDRATRPETARWLAGSLLRREPFSSAKYRSAAYRSRVRSLVATHAPDVAVIDHAQVGWITAELRGGSTGIIYVAHNVEHLMYRATAHGAGSRLRRILFTREAALARRLEAQLVADADLIWTLTEPDAETYRRDLGAPTVRVVPFGLPPPPARPAAAPPRCDIALIGRWTWAPNAQGLRWFVEEVMPRLPAGLQVEVAGSGGEWLDGRFANLRWCGVVPDAESFLAGARAVAIPAVAGGGIQVTTLTVIASGARVVTTGVGARGLGRLPRSVRTADGPERFARELAALAEPTGDASAGEEGRKWSADRLEAFRSAVERGVEDAHDARVRRHGR